MIWPILEARAEIQTYFRSFFGSNEGIQKSFWNYLTFRCIIRGGWANLSQIKCPYLARLLWAQQADFVWVVVPYLARVRCKLRYLRVQTLQSTLVSRVNKGPLQCTGGLLGSHFLTTLTRLFFVLVLQKRPLFLRKKLIGWCLRLQKFYKSRNFNK